MAPPAGLGGLSVANTQVHFTPASVATGSTATIGQEARWTAGQWPPRRGVAADDLRRNLAVSGSAAAIWAAAAGVCVGRALRRSRRSHTSGRAAVYLRAAKGRRKRGGQDENKPEEDVLLLTGDGMSLNELAKTLKKNPAAIITYFFAERGKALSINDFLDRRLCEEAARKFGVEILFDDEKVSSAANRGILKEDHSKGQPRPPVVTVMGHVDHGKTTLLDTIRKRSVAATEAGGITQRIGAYTAQIGDQLVTFIDTPGHEAFTAMRARGAQVTDIAVLVVAADDGVMPQTREAIAHAMAAEVPIIVAINKIDVPNAQAERTRQALSEENLLCEEWGGEITMVECSAKKNIGIDKLLEIIILTAEVADLKAPRDGPAAGVVLESTFDSQKGSFATLLVQRGTLHVGDNAVAGTKFCKVRAMLNEAGKDMTNVGPSTAVQVIGFERPPEAGEQFQVYPTIQEARELAERREREAVKAATATGFAGASLGEGALKLSVILKCDAQGSIAAVKHMFEGMKDSKYVNLRWVLAAPGPISDSDVELAMACPKDQRVMVVGFNTTASPSAVRAAKARSVEIRQFNIIYELFETIVAVLENQIGPEEQLVERGRAEVLATFGGRLGTVAGCRIAEGTLAKGNRVKVYRKGRMVGQGNVITLREGKEDVPEVVEGNECGFGIEGWDEWQKGDMVHCFEVSMVKPQLVKKKEQVSGKKASQY